MSFASVFDVCISLHSLSFEPDRPASSPRIYSIHFRITQIRLKEKILKELESVEKIRTFNILGSILVMISDSFQRFLKSQYR